MSSFGKDESYAVIFNNFSLYYFKNKVETTIKYHNLLTINKKMFTKGGGLIALSLPYAQNL
jgi:hypothetical protein